MSKPACAQDAPNPAEPKDPALGEGHVPREIEFNPDALSHSSELPRASSSDSRLFVLALSQRRAWCPLSLPSNWL